MCGTFAVSFGHFKAAAPKVIGVIVLFDPCLGDARLGAEHFGLRRRDLLLPLRHSITEHSRLDWFEAFVVICYLVSDA